MEVSCNSRIRSAYFKKIRPSSVRITFLEARSNSFFPTSFSSSTIRFVTVDCAIYICSAANVKFFTLQRQIKVFSSSVFIEKIDYPVFFFKRPNYIIIKYKKQPIRRIALKIFFLPRQTKHQSKSKPPHGKISVLFFQQPNLFFSAQKIRNRAP